MGFVFQNKMRSFRKLFFILSGRHEKRESGRWTDILIQRKTRDLRERKKGSSVVVSTLGLEIHVVEVVFRSQAYQIQLCILLRNKRPKKVKGNKVEISSYT